jgi:hypothetical protein
MVFNNGNNFGIKWAYIFWQSMYPEPTMVQNRYSSPIIISDEDTDSSIESESPWWGPENQLGLEPGVQFGFRRDDEEVGLEPGSWRDDDEVALDEKGEIKHHGAIAKYWNFT